MTVLGIGLARELSEATVLRFADLSSQSSLPSQVTFAAPEPDAPAVPAADWLRQQGWEKAWPKLLLGRGIDLFFAGPPTQRYLRVSADEAYAVWSRRLSVEPQQRPILDITGPLSAFHKRLRLTSLVGMIASLP
jgi:hypothetical protein